MNPAGSSMFSSLVARRASPVSVISWVSPAGTVVSATMSSRLTPACA